MSETESVKPIQYAVVGEENIANLRLSEILKGAYGRQNVKRLLELSHVREFLLQTSSFPVVICLDIFSYDLIAVTEFVGEIRIDFPASVFNLYLNKEKWVRRKNELPGTWARRFEHYFMTYHEDDDVEFEPIVRASLRGAQYEAIHNMGGNPVRLTPVAEKGLVRKESQEPDFNHTVFLSYSRQDWSGFVEKLVKGLTSGFQKVWLDQNYILGGDDWLDAVGTALQECDTLLLVLSPEALNSKYVKLEYRYFFQQDKPIIPILFRKVDSLPFELATLHYVDFTGGCEPEALEKIRSILAKRKSGTVRSWQ